MMRRRQFGISLLAGLATGCGGAPGLKPAPAMPHGGLIVSLPDDKGFAEIVTHRPKKGETTQSEFSVYFLGPDRATALAPFPTTAALTVSTPTGERNVELRPFNDALVSVPAAPILGGHDLDGTLSVEIGGQKIEAPIGGR